MPTLARVLPYVLLVAGTVAFRVPALQNARGVNSDSAIVGLQGMHVLRGEVSPFLWGTGYQGSFDAVAAAAGFAVFGTSALVLMWGPLAAYALMVVLSFSTLNRHTSRWAAFAAALLLVFTPDAVNRISLYPPRQWSITCLFLAIWLIDRPERRGRLLTLFTGALCLTLAPYLDLFTVQSLPAVGLFAALCAIDAASWKHRMLQIGAVAAGMAGGTFVVSQVGGEPLGAHATAILFHRIGANFRLLWDTCLPWLLGYGVYVPGANLYPDRWHPPAVLRVVQTAAGFSLVLLIASAGVFAVLRRIPWPARRLGLLGLAAAASAVGGFLVSAMPSDMWSTRYLTPVIWFAPFALAPLAAWLKPRALAVLLAPYLMVAAVGGWMSYGPYVNGPLPVRSPRGVALDEEALARFLRKRDVRFASAQYWLAYRLTFLFGEDPIVVPMNHQQDRYAPYLEGFRAAPVVAFIFHPSEPRASPGAMEPVLRRAGGILERHEVAGFTVLLHFRQ
jgi:hypothetical protein